MVKTLRLFLVATLTMVFGNAMAEDIIWQEDFSSFADGAVPVNETYGYVCTNGTNKGSTKVYANDNMAGGTKPELLIAKDNGTFSVTIPLGGKFGDMFLSFLTNKTITVSSDTQGVELGEPVKTGNNVTLTIIVPANTESLHLTFTNTSGKTTNARFDNVKLYQGTAKKPAGLSWGKASTSVTLNGDYSNIPTLQNPNELPVVYDSDKEDVCTVTNAGVITVVGAGKATISATFEGNEEYEAQSVSIEITVQPAINPDEKGQQNNPYLLTDNDFATLVNSLKPEDASSTASTNPKSAKIYIKGFIVNIEPVLETDLAQYGNMTFKIAATKGDYDAEVKLNAYRCYYLENKKFTSADQIKLDDEVVINGQIQWYGGAPQVASGCHIFSLNGETTGINELKAAGVQFEGKTYNAAGQLVNKAYKGLVIMNGRKFVNK